MTTPRKPNARERAVLDNIARHAEVMALSAATYILKDRARFDDFYATELHDGPGKPPKEVCYHLLHTWAEAAGEMLAGTDDAEELIEELSAFLAQRGKTNGS